MAAHRYWRFFVSRNAGQAYLGVGELVLAAAPGGAQAATGGVAFASSELTNNPASAAFDGAQTTGNGWQTQSTYTGFLGSEFIVYDMGAGRAIDVKELRIYIAAGTQAAAAPVNFTLSYSDDGVNWKVQRAWAGIEMLPGSTTTLNAVELESALVTNRLVAEITLRRNSSAQSQQDINFSASKFPKLFSPPNFVRPIRITPYSGSKRIAGSTTALGYPVSRRVNLVEQKSGLIVDTFDTGPDGAFSFEQVADIAYSVVGVDLSGEQNSIIYANITPSE